MMDMLWLFSTNNASPNNYWVRLAVHITWCAPFPKRCDLRAETV